MSLVDPIRTQFADAVLQTTLPSYELDPSFGQLEHEEMCGVISE